MPPLPSLAELVARLAPLAGVPAIAVAVVATALLLIVADWRAYIFILQFLYVALAVVSTQLLPPEWAVLRMLVGAFIGVMWYLSARQVGWGRRLPARTMTDLQPPTKRLPAWPALATTITFRVVVVVMVGIVFLLGEFYVPLPDLVPNVAFLCLWLTVMGVLTLALEEEPLKAGVGLLMWLAAVQVFYGNLTHDARMIGVLSALELLVGLASAYLTVARGQSDRDPQAVPRREIQA